MVTRRINNLFFGDEYPQHPRDTYLWIKTDDNSLLRYNDQSWVTISGVGLTNPLISSIYPNINDGSAGEEIAINGLNFAENVNVKFIGQDNTEHFATQVDRINSGRLSVTQPALLANNQPYSIKVINAESHLYTLENALNVGAGPSWTTPSGSIGPSQWSTGVAASVQLVATDPEGQTVSYALNTGSTLPGGLTLSASSGIISGALTSPSATTFNFSINAIDESGNATARSFSINSVGAVSTITFTTVGTTYWTAPATGTAQVLIVAGGGSGGYDVGGGGGGGGVIYNASYQLIAGVEYSVTVGAGGQGGGGCYSPTTERTNNGVNSSFGQPFGGYLTAIGGGGGGRYASVGGQTGGSGGGGQGGSSWGSGGAGTTNQGYAGGYNAGGGFTAGGGGGAGAVGGNSYSANGSYYGGTGGIGRQITIGGVTAYYGGGGGGGGEGILSGQTYFSSLGGLGGGGKGWYRPGDCTGFLPSLVNGQANTGGGGGGTGGGTGGGSGGSGIIIIQYPTQ
jgi:hypothetical protein